VPEKDYQQAFKWLEMSAEAGFVQAQRALSEMYAKGEGTEKDLEKAKYWLGKAAEQGDEDAGKIRGDR